jgi:hypothetical protein
MFVAVLRDSGVLAGSGEKLKEPIVRLASWLGPLGAAALSVR